VKDTLLKRGIEAEGSTPEALAQLIREDAVRWEKLVKEGASSWNETGLFECKNLERGKNHETVF
jgi:hypothetical protein